LGVSSILFSLKGRGGGGIDKAGDRVDGAVVALAPRATAAADAGGSEEIQRKGIGPLPGTIVSVALGVVWGDGFDDDKIGTAGVSVGVFIAIDGDGVVAVLRRAPNPTLLTGPSSSWRTDTALECPRSGEHSAESGCRILGEARHRAMRVSMRGGLRIAIYKTEAKMTDQPSIAIP
jgi:hypothetical protein